MNAPISLFTLSYELKDLKAKTISSISDYDITPIVSLEHNDGSDEYSYTCKYVVKFRYAGIYTITGTLGLLMITKDADSTTTTYKEYKTGDRIKNPELVLCNGALFDDTGKCFSISSRFDGIASDSNGNKFLIFIFSPYNEYNNPDETNVDDIIFSAYCVIVPIYTLYNNYTNAVFNKVSNISTPYAITTLNGEQDDITYSACSIFIEISDKQPCIANVLIDGDTTMTIDNILLPLTNSDVPSINIECFVPIEESEDVDDKEAEQ